MTVKARANVVGPTLLNTGKVAAGLTECPRCGTQISEGDMCDACSGDLADAMLQWAGEIAGIQMDLSLIHI